MDIRYCRPADESKSAEEFLLGDCGGIVMDAGKAAFKPLLDMSEKELISLLRSPSKFDVYIKSHIPASFAGTDLEDAFIEECGFIRDEGIRVGFVRPGLDELADSNNTFVEEKYESYGPVDYWDRAVYSVNGIVVWGCSAFYNDDEGNVWAAFRDDDSDQLEPEWRLNGEQTHQGHVPDWIIHDFYGIAPEKDYDEKTLEALRKIKEDYCEPDFDSSLED